MPRTVDYRSLVPGAVDALQNLEAAIEAADIDESLVELLKLRASQINRCAYCVDMHTSRARELGVADRRIAAVPAWHESPFFGDRERAAFRLTEALTKLSEAAVPDAVYRALYQHYDEEAVAVLVMVVNAINCWNRLWVSFQTPEIRELHEEEA